MNFIKSGVVSIGLQFSVISYIGHVHGQVNGTRSGNDIDEEVDITTIICIVVVVLVVLLKLYFCACCYGDCGPSERSHDLKGRNIKGDITGE